MTQTQLTTESKPSIFPVVDFSATEAAIQEMTERLTGLTAVDTASYRTVVEGVAECRELRVAVEKRRKELKEPVLEYGKTLDSAAKQVIDALFAIEEPLKITRQAYDAEKEKARLAKEEEKRKAIEEELAAKRAEEEAETARVKADRDAAEAAERARIKAEQEAEAAKLAEERKKLDAEKAAAEAELAEQRRIAAEVQAKMEKKLSEERAAFEAERQRLKAIEDERLAAEKAAAEKARLDALRPDFEKLQAWSDELLAIVAPEVSSDESEKVVDQAMREIDATADRIRAFVHTDDPLIDSV